MERERGERSNKTLYLQSLRHSLPYKLHELPLKLSTIHSFYSSVYRSCVIPSFPTLSSSSYFLAAVKMSLANSFASTFLRGGPVIN